MKVIKIEDISIRLHLWDIAGQDRLGGISNLFCRDAAGAIVVSDITEPNTLENAVSWKNQVDTHLENEEENIPMILAVNKYDLIEESEKKGEKIEEVMTEEYLEGFAKTHGFSGVFRTSAKTSMNVTATFALLVREILKQRAGFYNETTTSYSAIRAKSVQLNKGNKKKEKSK